MFYIDRCSLYPVNSIVALHLQTAGQMHSTTFDDLVEVLHILAFECRHIVPLGFDDRSALLVLIRAVGHHGELSHLFVVDVLEADAPHNSTQFNLVDLLHTFLII